MCPIFVGFQLSCLARYQKNPLRMSFGCKNLLNFTCHTKKFHTVHHSTLDVPKLYAVVTSKQRAVQNALKKHMALQVRESFPSSKPAIIQEQFHFQKPIFWQ